MEKPTFLEKIRGYFAKYSRFTKSKFPDMFTETVWQNNYYANTKIDNYNFEPSFQSNMNFHLTLRNIWVNKRQKYFPLKQNLFAVIPSNLYTSTKNLFCLHLILFFVLKIPNFLRFNFVSIAKRILKEKKNIIFEFTEEWNSFISSTFFPTLFSGISFSSLLILSPMKWEHLRLIYSRKLFAEFFSNFCN